MALLLTLKDGKQQLMEVDHTLKDLDVQLQVNTLMLKDGELMQMVLVVTLKDGKQQLMETILTLKVT